MHDATVEKFVIIADGKVKEAQAIALQVPDDLGGIRRTDIETALNVAAAAMIADVRELRGDVSAAHAFIRRCRFPRDEHAGLFGIMAEVGYALEDLEQAAGAADYPEPDHPIRLPSQHLVPRRVLGDELDELQKRLGALDVCIGELTDTRSGESKYADQDRLIDYTAEHVEAKSLLAHALAGEPQVDVRGLTHAVEGIGRIMNDFVSTIAPASARVTAVVRNSARMLGKAGRAVVSAGAAMVRTLRGKPLEKPMPAASAAEPFEPYVSAG